MKYKHLEFIKNKLSKTIKYKGSLEIGNNLNDYITFEESEKYVNEIKKQGIDRVIKSSKDILLGRLVEEIIIYLLRKVFTESKLNYAISNRTEGILKKYFSNFKIENQEFNYEKSFDIDIFIKNNKQDSKFFTIFE